jgi:integrase
MTGSIHEKTGRKNYYAVLSTYDDNGKRKQKWIDTGFSVKGNNKRKANEKLNELLALYGESHVDFSKDINFIDFLNQWLETIKTSNAIAPTTHDAYRLTLDKHILPYFEKKRLRVTDITPAHIQQYVNDKLKIVSSNTVRRHLANISKCLDSAVKQRIITINPVKLIELPQKVKFTGAKRYNEKQMEQLLECAKGDPLEIVIRLTLFYGLRRSEVLGLRWEAVNFEEKTLAIKHTVVKIGNVTHKNDRTKNASSRAVFPMPEKIIVALKQWQSRQNELKEVQPNDYHDTDYICTYADGRLLATDFVSQHFALLLKKNGLPHIRFHDLRHSAAHYLKFLGFDLKDIQIWLRHKDIQTTMNIYVDLDMDDKTNIANSLEAKFKTLEA